MIGFGRTGYSKAHHTPDHETFRADLLSATGWRVPVEVIREVARRSWTDDAFGLAGNVAFRTVLGLFPFLIFTSTLTVYLGDATMAGDLTDFLIAIVPTELSTPIVSEIRAVTTNGQGGILGLGLLLTIWFALGGIDGIRVSLNRSYGLHETRSTPLLYLIQGGMVVMTSLIFALVGYVLVATPRTGPWLYAFLPDPQAGSLLVMLIRYCVAVPVLVAGLLIAHLFLPARLTRIRSVWPGIAFTTLSWVLLGAAFSIYLRRFGTYSSYYAGLGGIIAALYFIYLAALILILGGELNRALKIRRLASEKG